MLQEVLSVPSAKDKVKWPPPVLSLGPEAAHMHIYVYFQRFSFEALSRKGCVGFFQYFSWD